MSGNQVSAGQRHLTALTADAAASGRNGATHANAPDAQSFSDCLREIATAA